MATRTIKVPANMGNGAQEIQVEDFGNSSWGPKDKHALVNTRVTRVDAPFKTTGKAMYTHDVRLEGMLHGRLVTSPHAHAKIVSVDTSVAEKMDGVKVVMVLPNQTGEVIFEGQPIVALAATTSEIAEDAANAVVVNYEKLPFIVTLADAA